jgi:hypothetical protein
MVAGIALIAVGIKRTLPHVNDPLQLVPAAPPSPCSPPCSSR